MVDSAMFELRSVGKSYGEATALRSISLSVAEGKTTVLIGPSGCGKSTLIRILIGLITPTTGDVMFDGVPLVESDVRTLRHRMGYVIQDGGLFPHMTARQNVCVMPTYLGWDESRTQSRLEELTALTHFPADALDRFPSELSGGQQQRVGLMRALILDPQVLLLDEPFGALDPMIRASLQSDVQEIIRSLKKTVVMVTHDLGEAAMLADEIVLMRDGEIVQQGSVSQLVESPANEFVTQFIRAQRSPLSEVFS